MTDIATLDTATMDSVVRRAASGDDAACTRLVLEHYAPMVRAAFVVVGDTETAREAVQVAWSKAWRQLGRIREPERVRPWLVAIAANEARRLIRREHRRSVVEIAAGTPGRSEDDPTAGIALMDLERGLRRLDPDDRALLALRYAAGLDSTQIAQQLGLSASGVRSRLARALDRLRKELEDA